MAAVGPARGVWFRFRGVSKGVCSRRGKYLGPSTYSAHGGREHVLGRLARNKVDKQKLKRCQSATSSHHISTSHQQHSATARFKFASDSDKRDLVIWRRASASSSCARAARHLSRQSGLLWAMTLQTKNGICRTSQRACRRGRAAHDDHQIPRPESKGSLALHAS